MTPIVLAFMIVCTTTPEATGKPFPLNYNWPAACLDAACPNVTASMNDLKTPGKGLKINDVLELGYMKQWHTAQCTGRG